jgi:glutamate synthase domain-containing protein 2
VTGKPVGIKAVIGQSDWLHKMCLRINERGLQYAPDFFTVDSADGGSGAAPQSLMDYMGLPLQRSLPLVVDKLVEHGLRERVASYAANLMHEVEVIAHSCGVAEPRLLNRGHAQVLNAQGQPEPL